MIRRKKKQTPLVKPLLDLFPDIVPYSTGFLDAEGHHIYWEQCGNPDGVPVLFVHGGPGGGCSPQHRRFFDPDHYRIILFDQRGCGRSHPSGSLDKNTLADLLLDIESLRGLLNIPRWHLFGGSWGSTLSLAYAQAHPERCISLMLYGIFLMEEDEINWFMYGIHSIFPEAWEQFALQAPEAERANLLRYYHNILTGDDEAKMIDVGVSWNLYESACASLYPNYTTITTMEQKLHAVYMARIEAHYFLNQVFTKENSLLNNINRIRSIPTVIVQGRYDMICPIVTAHKLHQSWPEADYIVVPDGGHSALDPAVRSRLIEATENAKTLR